MGKAPDDILRLIERFAANRDEYTRGAYNETQVRREFIDPFFTALGWDVGNREGLAEAYKDVIHEDAIKVGGTTKAPDYCFRIGGTRKFFVEAKKPSVALKDEPIPAYQLRRYAWSAKLPVSILTDFEEFAAYDRPDVAKAVMDLRVHAEGETRTRITTETRVHVPDAAARRRFRRYWFVVRPFSGLTRILLLRAARHRAEAAAA